MPDKEQAIERTYKNKMRRIPFYILIATLILLPTLFAVITVIYIDSQTSSMSSRPTEVVLYADNGTELYREHESEKLTGDTSLISIFNTIYNGLEEVESIPDDVLELPEMRAEILLRGVKRVLSCRFSMTEGSSYCTDELGYAYKIHTNDSERFLRSRFAEMLYSNSEPPTLMSADGALISPTAISWKYQNIDGVYMPSELFTTHAAGKSYSTSGTIALDFSIPPTSSSALVFENNVCVFEGSIDDLQGLTLKSDSTVNVKISAQWKSAADIPYNGTIEYDFFVAIHKRAVFSISKNILSDGDFALLTATNITDASKLHLSINGIAVTPELLLDKETAYALIPHSLAPREAKEMTLTVSYGVSENSFLIYVKHSPETTLKLANASATFGLAPDMLGSLKSPYLFFKATTAAPSPDEYQKSASFGQDAAHIEENGIYFFTEYRALTPFGSTVRASTAGLVSEIGENDTAGKYAVIDLGLGLRLTYFNLSFVDVREGAYIAIGDSVGKCGELSDNSGEGFSIMLSHGATVLDAEKLFG